MTRPAHHGLETENYPRCFGCGARAPQQTRNTRCGWKSRRIHFVATGRITELYCGACFKEFGWPDWGKIDRDWAANDAETQA